MKKIFFALAAVAALAACSKSEVEYEQTGEITFTPVTKNITKSMITGTAFPTSESFNVWAWYKQVPAGTTVEEWWAGENKTVKQETYINESPFVYRAETQWGGQTPYYWPKFGSLLFAGYYPTSIAGSVKYSFGLTETGDVTNQMVFTGIEQSVVSTPTGTEPVTYNEDIMYFNMTQSSVSSNSVSAVFRHALSWVTVYVKKAQMNPSPKIVIDDIKFTAVNPKGDGVVEGANIISWTTTGTAVDTPLATAVELSETMFKLPKEPLLIPQEMAGNLVVEYTVYSSDDEHFTEVATFPLKGMKDSNVGKNAPALTAWEPAKHYTYTITIGTEEILIEPTVADWIPVGVALPIN
jgi:hypothetical protein